jgi:hypothetical protein
MAVVVNLRLVSIPPSRIFSLLDISWMYAIELHYVELWIRYNFGCKLTSWPMWWQWKHYYGVDEFVFASYHIVHTNVCQCAPPWLPLYPLFELKQSIKKILLIVVESFGPTLALFDLILFPMLWSYWDSRTYWSWPNIIFTTFFFIMLNLIHSTIGTYQQVELDQCEATWHLVFIVANLSPKSHAKIVQLGLLWSLSYIDKVTQMGRSVDHKLSFGFCWNFFAICPF